MVKLPVGEDCRRHACPHTVVVVDSAPGNSPSAASPPAGQLSCDSRPRRSLRIAHMLESSAKPGYEVVDFGQLAGVPCPCGTARRAFADVADFPGTIHRTSISIDAREHYHRRLTEVYYILQCGPEAQMELDGRRVDVGAGQAILIRPGVRHRAIGRMEVLVVVYPKFDPADEWFD